MGTGGSATGKKSGHGRVPAAVWMSLRRRWAVLGALAAASALGVAVALSLGGGTRIQVPGKVALHSRRADSAAVPAHGSSPASLPPSAPSTTAPVVTSPAGPSGAQGVTVVTAAPQVVVEPSDDGSGAATGSNASGADGRAPSGTASTSPTSGTASTSGQQSGDQATASGSGTRDS